MPKITKRERKENSIEGGRRKEKRLILYYDYSQSQHCDTYNIYSFDNISISQSFYITIIHIHTYFGQYLHIHKCYIYLTTHFYYFS